MSYEGSDFGFVGASYTAPDPFQDRQRTLNYYPEVSQSSKSKTTTALLGCPGLSTVLDFSGFTSGGVRGAWVLPGNTKCLFVAGDRVLLVTMTIPATQTSLAQFSTEEVGTLLTNHGPVCIRDNGPGGFAVIVDGPNGYFVRMAGAGTYTFTGDVTSGSAVVSLPGTLPSGLIISPEVTVSDSAGFIPPGTTISEIDVNTPSITLSASATNTSVSDTLTLTIPQFGQITDPNFQGGDRIAFIDGWLIFNVPGTQRFYTNAPQTYTLIFDGAFFALKDSSTDNLVTHMENNREWWGVGERTSEVWYDAGGGTFALSRIPGVSPQLGCSAAQSIARLGDSLCWLAQSERGQNVVVKTEQYSYSVISDHGVETAIASYPLISDAIGYTYEDQGHLFYVLTFPTADKTWVFDVQSKAWHERASFDPTTGAFHRHKSNCFVNFQDIRMVGDYQAPLVYNMSRKFYTDGDTPLVGIRRGPILWSRENRKRVFHASLQIDFAPGQGLQTGQGDDPQAMLRWSDDAGATWGNEHWTTIGKAGRTKNRAMWRRLGEARNRVYEMTISDPVNRDIVGATLFAQSEVDAA